LIAERAVRAATVRRMDNHRKLAVLDAARGFEKELNHLIDHGPRRLLHIGQLRDSAHSIPSNIAEGFGRGTEGERRRSLRVARGEAEETIEHLEANFAAGRLDAKAYFRLYNRLITISKMLTSLHGH
jgi:four helix bundle protein